MEMFARFLCQTPSHPGQQSFPSLSRLSLLFSRWARRLHGPRLLHSNLLPGSDLLSRLTWPYCHRRPGPEFIRPAHIQGLLWPHQFFDRSQQQSHDTLGQPVQQQVNGLMNYWQLFNYLDHVSCLLSHYQLGRGTCVCAATLKRQKELTSLCLCSHTDKCVYSGLAATGGVFFFLNKWRLSSSTANLFLAKTAFITVKTWERGFLHQDNRTMWFSKLERKAQQTFHWRDHFHCTWMYIFYQKPIFFHHQATHHTVYLNIWGWHTWIGSFSLKGFLSRNCLSNRKSH